MTSNSCMALSRNFASGWVAGSIDMKDFELRILSVELCLAIVNVDYRYAPRASPNSMYSFFHQTRS